MISDPRIFDQYRRQRLWAKPEPIVEAIEQRTDSLELERLLHKKGIAVDEVVDAVKENRNMAANTGAKGFASILKARAAQMREEFSRLANELNGEFDAMATHLSNGKAQVEQMKADNKELREALGLDNNPN